MRMGIMIGATTGARETVGELVELVQRAESDGFDTAWQANILAVDALTTLSIAAVQTSRIELGTAVVPVQPRHPTVMAQQALTANAAAKGRFALGIGLSHKMFIEDIMGLSYAKPAATMAEYLEVLNGLLSGEGVSHAGERYRINAAVNVPGATPPPVIVAAMGPKMLEIAGRHAAGTTLWVTGVKTIADHIVPVISRAAKDAGRSAPRIVAGLPIALSNDVDKAKAVVADQLAIYGQLPSYRAMLDREGAAGPADVALLGDEATLREKLRGLKEAGVTDFNAAIVDYEEGAFERTWQFLKDEL